MIAFALLSVCVTVYCKTGIVHSRSKNPYDLWEFMNKVCFGTFSSSFSLKVLKAVQKLPVQCSGFLPVCIRRYYGTVTLKVRYPKVLQTAWKPPIDKKQQQQHSDTSPH